MIETAAGDKSRFISQSLSAESNSFPNDDQNIPTYASVATSLGDPVPISTFLSCCDDERRHTAKAIGLSSNLMMKEPILVRTKRIIGEWIDFDDAAGTLTEKTYEAF